MLFRSLSECAANIILVSKTNDYRLYKNVNVYIVLDEKFNYNRFVNQGLKFVKNDWILISNDDVEYMPGWFAAIKKVAEERPDIESFSPMDPRLHQEYFNSTFRYPGAYVEGHATTRHISGWAIVMKSSLLEYVVPFDEDFDMYYQDNDYGQVLITSGKKHALVKTSIAYHKGTELIEEPFSKAKDNKFKEDELKFRTKWNIWK